VTTGAFGAFSAISIYRGNEKFFDSIVMPLVHTLNPETSHKIAIIASKYGLFSRSSYDDPVTLVRYSLVSQVYSFIILVMIYVNEIIYTLQINFNILDSIILAITYLLLTLLVKCVRGSGD
jgi:hypothetical protein